VITCFATGTVVSTDADAGGLVGTLWDPSSITNSYATGSVTGTNAGGLLGRNASSDATSVRNCYATGRVSGTGLLGGLVARQLSSQQSGSYWAYDSVDPTYGTRQPNSDGEGAGIAEPKTEAELQTQATFVGWDFTTIWDITEGVSYPTLL